MGFNDVDKQHVQHTFFPIEKNCENGLEKTGGLKKKNNVADEEPLPDLLGSLHSVAGRIPDLRRRPGVDFIIKLKRQRPQHQQTNTAAAAAAAGAVQGSLPASVHQSCHLVGYLGFGCPHI